MLYGAALFAAVCLLVYLVRGDVDRRPGPIRSILLYTLLIGLPLGLGEYRGLARQGHTGAWWVILLYLAGGFVVGCIMWFVERRKPRKARDERDV
jgi:hypothetical protein